MAQLSPIFNLPYFTDNNGDPLAGGRIFTYEAGSTSSLKATYVDQAETASNPNPIVLDAAGRLPGGTAIWLSAGELYNLILTAPDGTTVLKSFDDVSGVILSSGGGGGGGGGVWVETPGASYLSSTSFLVPGNFTAQYGVGNRVRVTITGGYTYGVVTAVSFGGGNTTVTILVDGANLNPSLSAAEYSVLFASPAEAVDAGGVSYFDALPYSAANTVGNKVKALDTSVTAVTNRVNSMRQVWPATGPAGAYTVTVNPAFTSYSADQILTVRFQNAGTGVATININDLGAVGLSQYNTAGTLGNPVIAAGQVSDIAYNGSVFVLLDSLAPAAAAAPRGIQVFTSNGTFTTPAGVSTIRVTCIGGGGGGGSSVDVSGFDSPAWLPGGGGGGGCTSVRYFPTAPGATYAVAIGVAGTGGAYIGPVGTNGGPGGTTSFGVTLVTAPGGSGGVAGGPGGLGGTGGVGELVFIGTPGGVTTPGVATGGGSYGFGGAGGQPAFGQGGLNGTAGVCYVEW